VALWEQSASLSGCVIWRTRLNSEFFTRCHFFWLVLWDISFNEWHLNHFSWTVRSLRMARIQFFTKAGSYRLKMGFYFSVETASTLSCFMNTWYQMKMGKVTWGQSFDWISVLKTQHTLFLGKVVWNLELAMPWKALRLGRLGKLKLGKFKPPLIPYTPSMKAMKFNSSTSWVATVPRAYFCKPRLELVPPIQISPLNSILFQVNNCLSFSLNFLTKHSEALGIDEKELQCITCRKTRWKPIQSPYPLVLTYKTRQEKTVGSL